ncbi:hypothetical protein ES708_20230 [subsurface metagenome]
MTAVYTRIGLPRRLECEEGCIPFITEPENNLFPEEERVESVKVCVEVFFDAFVHSDISGYDRERRNILEKRLVFHGEFDFGFCCHDPSGL